MFDRGEFFVDFFCRKLYSELRLLSAGLDKDLVTSLGYSSEFIITRKNVKKKKKGRE